MSLFLSMSVCAFLGVFVFLRAYVERLTPYVYLYMQVSICSYFAFECVFVYLPVFMPV